jgi:hypothetical protein
MISVTGCRKLRLVFALLGGMLLASAIAIAFTSTGSTSRKRISPLSTILVFTPIVLGALAGAAACAYGFVASKTRYTLRDGVLCAEGPFGPWSVELAAARSYSVSPYRTITLTSDDGRRVRFVPELTDDPGKAFEMAVIAALKPVLDRMVDDIQLQDRVFRPWQSGQPVFVGLALVFGMICLAAVVDTSAGAGTAAERTEVAIMLAAIVVGLGLAAYLAQSVTITLDAASVILKMPWKTRAAQLAEVEQVQTRITRHSSRVIQTTSLISPAGKIKFDSTMPDYPIARAFVERRVSEQVNNRGAVEMARSDARRRIAPYVGAALILALCVTGYWFIAAGVSRMGLQARLDREGRDETGVITERYEAGAETTTCNVRYRFFAGLREYRGKSALIRDDYDRLEVGQPIKIRFLPVDPAISRARESIDERRAQGLVAIGALNLGCAALLVYAAIRAARRRTSQLR